MANDLSDGNPTFSDRWSKVDERSPQFRGCRRSHAFCLILKYLFLVGGGIAMAISLTTVEQPGFGIAIGMWVMASVLWVAQTILAGQMETIRLLTELWG